MKRLVLLHRCLREAFPIVFIFEIVRVNAAATTDFDVQHKNCLTNNPPDVVFLLRLKDGKTQFHPGESIRLELCFSSKRKNTYTLDDGRYDRSGRLPNENWNLEPGERVTDPLQEYFEGGCFMGGGLRGMPTLTSTNEVITVDLNEWFKIDQPGKYRLYDVSARIIDQRNPPAAQQEKPIASNVVTFEILPTDQSWAAKRLENIKRTLKTAIEEEPLRDAARGLRFLNTEGAARELVNQIGNEQHPGHFEFHLGLFSSPYRKIIVEEMEKKLVAADYPISDTFYRDLVKLKALLLHPEPLPVVIHTLNQNTMTVTNEEAVIERWRKTLKIRNDEGKQLRMTYFSQLLDVVSAKKDFARAMTLRTLLNNISNTPLTQRNPDSAKQFEKLQILLAVSFQKLPNEIQANLLEYNWQTIRCPGLLPPLRNILQSTQGKAAVYPDLRGLALRRIYELSPEEGRKLILQEIRTPQISVYPAALGVLSDKTLPDLDEVFAEGLEKRKDLDGLDYYSFLVGRYATGAILERVKKFFGGVSKGWACAIQAPLLAYFLRVDPPYGSDLVDQAVDFQGTGCRHTVLEEVAKMHWDPSLEKIAIKHLSNPDPEVAASAARMLKRYGSPAALKSLQDRLQNFHSQWKDHPKDLDFGYGDAKNNASHAQLENALVDAIGGALHWFPDKTILKQTEAFCVTSNSLRQVQGWMNEGITNSITHVNLGDRDDWQLSMARCQLNSEADLKTKLSQFPPGTVFIWNWWSNGNPEEESRDQKLFGELQKFLAQHNIKLERNVVPNDEMNFW
ncbi:MAG: hypothetical protein HY360_06610 [Verrucomicrobia bacterium]|nr:hypothetical protein [Verrucomicrobiota bacterium]